MEKTLYAEVQIWDEDTNPKTFCFEEPLDDTGITYTVDENGELCVDEDEIKDYVVNYHEDVDVLEDLGFVYDAKVRFVRYEINDDYQ